MLTGKPTFGAGRAFATANASATPTPIRALVPQSQSIDVKRKTDNLYGQGQVPVVVTAGEMDISGKVEFAKISGRMFSDLFFAAALAAGCYAEADNEPQTVPSSGAHAIAVVNAAEFLFDLGVVNATSGAIYTCVAAGSETAGSSYSVATSGANLGKYTFAAGDGGSSVLISYAYQQPGSGEIVALGNPNQGVSGGFQAVHVLPWGAEQDMFVFYNCVADATGVALKKSGFAGFTLEYSAGQNSAGLLGVATFAEASGLVPSGQLDFSQSGDSGFIPTL